MTIAEIQQEILRMKKEKDICILAHAYQGQEILEVADYTGDSYGLSVQASKRDCSGVIIPDASVRHINLVRYLFFIYLNCSLLSAAYSRPLFPEICISSIA